MSCFLEAEQKIKERDRAYMVLKSESQFALEMEQDKYQRLLKQFEKLKAQYQEEIGEGGAQEL